jgi:hypothetical protein
VAAPCRGRSPLFPADRGRLRYAATRQGAWRSGLAAAGYLRRTGRMMPRARHRPCAAREDRKPDRICRPGARNRDGGKRLRAWQRRYFFRSDTVETVRGYFFNQFSPAREHRRANTTSASSSRQCLIRVGMSSGGSCRSASLNDVIPWSEKFQDLQ